MGALTAHPVTIALALVSMGVWSKGKRDNDKMLVKIGFAISCVALLTYFLGV
ncbi:MAG: hypothetical protein IIY94_02210 [Oscillospiraceae bacterium]|nr:hypothetical protein [Oscillospiraceae bacterium]